MLAGVEGLVLVHGQIRITMWIERLPHSVCGCSEGMMNRWDIDFN